MLTTQLQNAAQIFGDAVIATPEMDTFIQTKTAFRANPDLQDLRKRLSERKSELQQKQNSGDLTQEEIDDLRFLQNALNFHPITRQFIQARQSIIAQLSECNVVISEEIGFDFASVAAPQSCCG